MPKYSLIVCTYNRSSFLKETIESILNNFKDKNNFELLIIDNNSTDNTLAVVQQFSQYPQLKYFLEKNQGLSFARNRGIKEANSEILVFLDDDIDIDKNYLDICDSLYKDPNTYIVGGKVLPYQVQIPKWLPAKFHYLASVYDLGDKPCSPTKLMGANHSFRKEIVKIVGLYNTKLGPIGNYKIGGDEDDYLQRAQRSGYTLLYHPNLIVYHKIENRLNKEFIYKYALRIGTSQAQIDAHFNKFRFFLKSILSLLRIIIYYLYGYKVSVPSKQVSFKIQRFHGEGYLRKSISMLDRKK